MKYQHNKWFNTKNPTKSMILEKTAHLSNKLLFCSRSNRIVV